MPFKTEIKRARRHGVFPIILMACALLVAPPHLAHAQTAPEPLRAGYYEIPPYLETVDGKLAGRLFDIWEGLVIKLGLSYVPVNLPPARLVKSVAEGDVDISLLPISFPELAGRVLASKLPVEHIILEAYTIYPSLPVTKIQDLIGKSVILQQGFGYGGLINFLRAPENTIKIVGTVPSAENGVRMLTAERGDVLLHYRPAIDKLRTRMDLSGLKANVLSAVPVHVVLSKSVPNSEALMARIDAVVIPSLLLP